MATAVAKVKELNYQWEGKDKSGKVIRGEMRAGGEALVNVTLRRQGIIVTKVKQRRIGRGGSVSDKDVTLFTRQLATMMKAGVPLLQSFDIVGKGHANPAVETLLDRLANYKEKILAIKSKIKSALFYPVAIIVVAFIITAVIMIFVIPAFKQVFTSFGADLPAPTLLVMAISDVFVKYWYIIFAAIGGGVWGFLELWKRSVPVQIFMDRLMLKLPIFGDLVKKSTIARWTRTLSTMFAAGVPLVEALDSVGGASGNYVYVLATKEIQKKVSGGTSLTASMQEANVFPNMVIQMVLIGEESGALDSMLGKVADFFEAEVDDAVEGLSSLMEPLIMVVLGVLIGGMVIAMYLPIFKIGQAV